MQHEIEELIKKWEGAVTLHENLMLFSLSLKEYAKLENEKNIMETVVADLKNLIKQ